MWITTLLPQCIRLGHHLKASKRVKGVMPDGSNKLHYMTVKFYRVISIFNCIGKVFKKVVVDMIAE